MAAAPIRVLLADDTADLRLLLRISLEAGGEFTIVGEAADGAEAVELAAADRPDAVVLDLAMPVMDGLEAAERIRTESPSTKIVVLSGFDGERMAEAALARGASSLQLVTIPPGGRARAHLHEHHESAAYVLSGQVGTWFGEGLSEYVHARPGDFVYIPAGVPHLPFNPSDSLAAVAVIARTDASAHEPSLLLPELDGLARLANPPLPSSPPPRQP